MSKPDPSRAQLPIVLAITGASGAIYAARTLQWLLAEGCKVHLVASPDGKTVIRQELQYEGGLRPHEIRGFFDAAHRLLKRGSGDPKGCQAGPLPPQDPDALSQQVDSALDRGLLTFHDYRDYFSPIASGSFRTAGMVVCPCSGTTLAAIAQDNGRNLIHRAAEVHLKERRKLVLVPRETPLSLTYIKNMLRATQAGAIVLPASPGWYHGVGGLSDLVDFVAARILDQMDVPHERIRRWNPPNRSG